MLAPDVTRSVVTVSFCISVDAERGERGPDLTWVAAPLLGLKSHCKAVARICVLVHFIADMTMIAK